MYLANCMQVLLLTLCGPLWLLYVSRKMARPVKASLLPNTGPEMCKNLCLTLKITNNIRILKKSFKQCAKIAVVKFEYNPILYATKGHFIQYYKHTL